MLFRAVLPAAALAAIATAAPASAWTTSVPAGDFRLTASIEPTANGARALSLALTPEGAATATGMTLQAWFVDSEGLILGPASLGSTHASGMTRVALDPSLKVPANAASLVVLAQPPKLQRTAAGDPAPAVVTQIALPAEVKRADGA